MEYNVGDKVRIKSIHWYNDNKDENGFVNCGTRLFYPVRSKLCGEIFTISKVFPDFYLMSENDYEWTDEMIECKVEKESKSEPRFKVGDRVCSRYYKLYDLEIVEVMTMRYGQHYYRIKNHQTNRKYLMWEYELSDYELVEEEIEFTEEDKYWCDIMSEFDPTTYVLPQGYQFKDENGNVIQANKIILEKKKKEYPKSFGECCKILGTYSHHQSIVGYKNELFSTLQKLYICRDAYWRVYGEENGLEKPWEPDWENCCATKYAISCVNNKLRLFKAHEYNYILVFPTEEMRDEFYENFKEEIEICKEFL